MSVRFQTCIDFVIAHEAEYNRDGSVRTEHDKNDPGGTTRYGLDQRSHPQINIETLTLEEAKKIYHDDEWTRCRCDDLGKPWDLAVFDAAVNLGKGWAVPALQKVVGAKVDSFIGPETIEHVKEASPVAVERYLIARENHYRSLKLSLRQLYLKGWLNRVADLRKAIAA
jgi:lysozyme family protein